MYHSIIISSRKVGDREKVAGEGLTDDMISSKKRHCVPRFDISLEQEADVVLDDLMLPARNRRLDHSKDTDDILAIASRTQFEFRHDIRGALSLFSYPCGIIGDRTTRVCGWGEGGEKSKQRFVGRCS